jgi:putative Holliday junction resolvase
MKYLGIDYGTKRIGLALSDESATLAFPHSVLPNAMGVTAAIEDLIRSEKIEGIVMGESVNTDGSENPVQVQAKNFASALERRFEVPVYFEKEFFTSVEAHGRQGKESLHARKQKFEKPDELDARAAALILQRYLDKQKKS